MSKFLKVAAAALIVAGPVHAEGFGLGRPALPEEVAAWDTDVRPDGLGLPEGSGTVEDGEVLYTDNCAMCHGDFGEAIGRWPVLAGGDGSLASDRPVKTIGSYWPYLSTVYDYVHRAMPFGNAGSLSADDTYAIVAYLLYLNDIVDDDFELSRENFTEVKLPNEANFVPDDRVEVEFAAFVTEPCMENCKDEVKITKRAAVLDVTPDGGGGVSLDEGGAPAAAEAPAEAAPVEVAAAPAVDMALAAEGESLFRQCKACHAVGEGAANKSGPQLNAVLGRTAGSIDGFKYSNGMVSAGEGGLVWSEETLEEFLAAPKSYVKGTKMSFKGFKDEDDAKAVVEYLKTFGGEGS